MGKGGRGFKSRHRADRKNDRAGMRHRLVYASINASLGPAVVDRLRLLRGPGESFSDVILAAGRDGARAVCIWLYAYPAFFT